MAKGLPRRVRDLARRLGIPDSITDRDEVVRQLQIDAEFAAEEVVKALDRFIQQINDTSIARPLDGYVAYKELVDQNQNVVLKKSRIDVSGKYQWVVFVIPSDDHASADFNLFDVLDSGRKALPQRIRPYPLWNTERVRPGATSFTQGRMVALGGKPVRGAGGRFTIAQAGYGSDNARTEPRFALGTRGRPLNYTFGPIRAVPALRLYARAVAQAKDRLAGSGFDSWDVVHATARGSI